MKSLSLGGDLIKEIFKFVPRSEHSKIMCLNKTYKDDYFKMLFHETREKIGVFGKSLILEGLLIIEDEYLLTRKYNISLKKIEEDELFLSARTELKQKNLNEIQASILNLSRLKFFEYLFNNILCKADSILKTASQILLYSLSFFNADADSTLSQISTSSALEKNLDLEKTFYCKKIEFIEIQKNELKEKVETERKIILQKLIDFAVCRVIENEIYRLWGTKEIFQQNVSQKITIEKGIEIWKNHMKKINRDATV